MSNHLGQCVYLDYESFVMFFLNELTPQRVNTLGFLLYVFDEFVWLEDPL